MSRIILCLLSCVIVVGCGSARQAATIGPSAEQRRVALETVAGFKHLGFQVVAARLKLGVQTDLAWRQLDSLLTGPSGDIFWMYPATGFYFNLRDQLSPEWRARFKETWKRYTPYRGDTENHFLMYYASLYLFSQEWPEMTGAEWFNGKSSREINAEASEYLTRWIDETVRYGMTEFDSPRYLYYYIIPLILLRDFSRDSVMRRRSEMMLEYQLADYAVEYLNGSYCGAHSRDGDGAVIDPRKAEATSYAQLYFEDSLSLVLPDLAYAAMSDFQAPEVIRQIAHERARPFVHMERKRSRAKMRYSAERFTPVLKYNYMTRDYCLGSSGGGLQQPIQQHSWDVTFASRRANNTIFGLHPQESAMELGMFFPEEPELMREGVVSSKASYGNENKWVGGSPYEGIAQERSTLVAIYRIPPSAAYQHVDIFLPKTLDTVERDPSGWIFCRMEGAFVGIHPFDGAYEWIEESINWRVRTRRGSTGYVVECGSASETSWESFKAALARKTPQFDAERSTVAYTTLRGREMTARLGVDGTMSLDLPDGRGEEDPLVRSDRALFRGPFLKSEIGSGVLEMRGSTEVKTLDFNRRD